MVLYQQAAAIPYRILDQKLQVLLISSRNGKKWIIPKGIIEKGDSPETTALKETREEAGVEGQLTNGLIGKFSYQKWGGICKVRVFPLLVSKVLDQWDEDFRERKWVDVSKALTIVKPKKAASIINKFEKVLKKQGL